MSAAEEQVCSAIPDLHVRVRRGSPDRIPLLVMNGIGAQLEALQPFVDALNPEIPVIRFDAPGVGQSLPAGRPYRFRTLVRRVARLLDDLGYSQVDVLGMSWGGGLAQQFALSQRHRCRRLVLVATGTGSIMVPAGPRVLWHMLTPRRYLDPGYLRGNASSLYGGLGPRQPGADRTTVASRRAQGLPGGLRLPTARRRGVDQPAFLTADHSAHTTLCAAGIRDWHRNDGEIEGDR